ncbi:hypothetical protein Scep_027802 [Stephania cephalantha]|uniref:Folate gamma-glutamyl hydrolase n=1 Tax=Stephania cephalantha TaxID=152367 RepID=A0AAP0E8L8_9MAGN
MVCLDRNIDEWTEGRYRKWAVKANYLMELSVTGFLLFVSATLSSKPCTSGQNQITTGDVRSYKEIWNYLWIPVLISLSKELIFAKAHQSILLPSEEEEFLSASTATVVELSCSAFEPVFSSVIGILSHPGDGASGRLNNGTNASYIAASYAKFVEAAGARVIPLIYNEPPEVLAECLVKKAYSREWSTSYGGWAKTGLYFETVQRIFKDDNILEKFRATDQASTLQFVKSAALEGTVFERFPPELIRKLRIDCLVMQNHQYGVSPERFLQNNGLSRFFNILTTSTDAYDKVYVSTIQARNYPVTAFQWHPEKNAFEWGLSMIPHSEDAIQVTQHVANYLISEARRSLNRPAARDVLDNLIYNFSPTYCGKAG